MGLYLSQLKKHYERENYKIMKTKHFNTLFKYGEYLKIKHNKEHWDLKSVFISKEKTIIFIYNSRLLSDDTIYTTFDDFSNWLENEFKNGN